MSAECRLRKTRRHLHYLVTAVRNAAMHLEHEIRQPRTIGNHARLQNLVSLLKFYADSAEKLGLPKKQNHERIHPNRSR